VQNNFVQYSIFPWALQAISNGKGFGAKNPLLPGGADSSSDISL
jgi:hypothetical protein